MGSEYPAVTVCVACGFVHGITAGICPQKTGILVANTPTERTVILLCKHH